MKTYEFSLNCVCTEVEGDARRVIFETEKPLVWRHLPYYGLVALQRAMAKFLLITTDWGIGRVEGEDLEKLKKMVEDCSHDHPDVTPPIGSQFK